MAEQSKSHSSRRKSSYGNDERYTPSQSRRTSESRRTPETRRTSERKSGTVTRSPRNTSARTSGYGRTSERTRTSDRYRNENPTSETLRTTATRNSSSSRKTTAVRGKATVKRKKRKKSLFHIVTKFFSIRDGLDRPFFLLVIVLLIVGLTMMFSASYAYAYYNSGDSLFYLVRQAGFAVGGVILMIGISYFDYRYLYKLDKVILITAFILLVVTLFMPARNGVHRWIEIGSLFSFQASEVMKFAIILFYAKYSYEHFEKMGTFRYGVVPALAVGLPTIFLLYLEPHYSCIVIIILLLAVMAFIAGLKIKWFLLGGGLAGLGFVLLTVFDKLQYAQERLDGWGLALEENLSADMQWKVWQTMNSLYAIGSGGLTGLGIGQSREKYLYLPEPQNDFVFAVVVEELGLIGGVVVMLLFIGLIVRGVMISLEAHDKFGMLLGVGLMSQIGIQVLINILVVTDTLPNTGISLPFFSYGGTSLVMLLAQMGIVLSISRNANIEKT